jgi:hypothetical protein
VRFSDDDDAVVGRRHARITRNPALTSLFFITDLDSRNGTFVNNQRVQGAVTLNPGDVVQCGPGGPEFLFDVESEPVRRYAEPRPGPPANPFKQTPEQAGVADLKLSNLPAEVPSRKRGVVVGVVLIGLIAIGGGYAGYRSLRSNYLSGAARPGAAPEQNASPDTGAEKYGHVHLSGAAAESEKDAQRAAWRIEVEPYLALGSGRPGSAASDFNKPAGVAFSPTGLLFATDDVNRRVQVWDVKTGSRITEFSHEVLMGEIADIAIAPDSRFLVTDRTRGLAYAFAPRQPVASTEKGRPLGPYDYQFTGVRFGDQGFVKLGGVAVDSKGRVYVVDALRNEVLRFNPDGAPDKTWNFEKTRADGDTYLRGCDGIAIDEAMGDLFVASEKDAVVEVFDWETGAYKNRTVGASKDASGKPSGKRVFFGSVKGMTVANRRLLAVDESAGHIQVFDLKLPEAFNNDLDGYAAPQPVRSSGYQGFFGRAPLYDFEDRTDAELQRKVKSGEIIPGQANPPGYFCSPGAIASHTDRASGETYIAVTDQCNYRIVVYRWSDIAKGLGIAETPTSDTLAANKPTPEIKSAPVAASQTPVDIRKNVAPTPGRVTSPIRPGNVTNAGNAIAPNKAPGGGNVIPPDKPTSAGNAATPNKPPTVVNIKIPDKPTNPGNVTAPNRPTSGTKAAATGLSGASAGKKNQPAANNSDPTISGKKGKKAKKEKKDKKGKKDKKAKF